MINENYNRNSCPIMQKCLREAFLSFMKIMEMLLLIFFIFGSLYVAVKTSDMIWRIGAIVMIIVCVTLFFWLNIYKLIGLKETADYLQTLSDGEYSRFLSQIEHLEDVKPIYLLDDCFFAPSAPILARYEEITGVEVVTRYYNGVKNSYTVKLQFRGLNREITMNMFMGFEPDLFKTELESKMQGVSSLACSVVFSEKKM